MSKRSWLMIGATTLVCGLLLVGCSDDEEDASTTPSDSKNVSINTPDGQVSLSLNGKLPPGWPSDVPVPSGAQPAGSGSLANGERSAMIGVYAVSSSPKDVAAFYKDAPDVKVGEVAAASIGDSDAVAFDMSEPIVARVTITPSDDGSRLVITTRATSTSTSTSP